MIASVISKRASQCDSQRGSRAGERGCADEWRDKSLNNIFEYARLSKENGKQMRSPPKDISQLSAASPPMAPPPSASQGVPNAVHPRCPRVPLLNSAQLMCWGCDWWQASLLPGIVCRVGAKVPNFHRPS
jgi:hypothetical protein